MLYGDWGVTSPSKDISKYLLETDVKLFLYIYIKKIVLRANIEWDRKGERKEGDSRRRVREEGGNGREKQREKEMDRFWNSKYRLYAENVTYINHRNDINRIELEP